MMILDKKEKKQKMILEAIQGKDIKVTSDDPFTSKKQAIGIINELGLDYNSYHIIENTIYFTSIYYFNPQTKNVTPVRGSINFIKV